MFNPPKEDLIKLNPQKVIDIFTINQSLPSWSSFYLAIQVRLRPCLRHQRSRHCSYRRSDVTVNRYVMVNACHDWIMQGVPLGNHQDSWASSSSKDVGNRWNGFFFHDIHQQKCCWNTNTGKQQVIFTYFCTCIFHILVYIYLHVCLHVFLHVFLHIYVNVISGMILFWDTPKSNSKSSYSEIQSRQCLPVLSITLW